MSDQLSETVNYYLLETGKTLANGVVNSVSWTASKVTGSGSKDSQSERFDTRWEDENY